MLLGLLICAPAHAAPGLQVAAPAAEAPLSDGDRWGVIPMWGQFGFTVYRGRLP